MTLQEAIEILSLYEIELMTCLPDAECSAVKLGIEALKRVQRRRAESGGKLGPLLPGETEE